MKIKSKYSNMPYQTISRKVWSSLIDGLLLLVFGAILTFSVGFNALRNNETFTNYNNQCFNSINEMYKIQNDAKLQIISGENEKKVLSAADYFDIYINKQIKLSYLLNETDFINNGIVFEINNDYSTIDNDELTYYFIKYKVDHSINIEIFENINPLTYFKERIFFKNINKDYFIDRENDLPILKPGIAIALYKHYTGIEKNTNLHREFSDAVLSIRNIGLNDLSNYSEFKKYYNLYFEAYEVMKKYDNITLFLSFLAVFILIIFLPSLITKDGITLGKLLTSTRVIHDEGYSIGKTRILLYIIFAFILNIFIIIFISLFTFGFENLTLVIFNIGNVDVSLLFLLLMSIAFVFVNFIIIAITPNHHSLIDIILNTKQIDNSTYVEIKEY